MRKVKALIAVAVLGIVSCGFSCHQAAKVSRGAAATLAAMQDAEDSLHKAGKITDAEDKDLADAFLNLGNTGKSVNKCIGAGGGAPCVDVAIAAVEALVSTKIVGIKNPDSRNQIQLLAQSLMLALNNLKVAL